MEAAKGREHTGAEVAASPARSDRSDQPGGPADVEPLGAVVMAVDQEEAPTPGSADVAAAEQSEAPQVAPPIIVQPRLAEPVLVSDAIPKRQRRLEDAFEAAASLLGIALVLLFATYAHSTTQGVEQDVRAALDSVIRSVLFLPLSVVEGLFVIITPVALVVSMARRDGFGSTINLFFTGFGSALVSWGIALALPHLPIPIADALTVTTPSGPIDSINLVFMVLAAMMTVSGTMSSSRVVKYSWITLWVLLFFSLITGSATLPGILVTVLLGRLLGCVARWIAGFNDLRAMPAQLVEAALDVGLQPVRIVRVDTPTQDAPLETWQVKEADAVPDYRRGQIHPPLETLPLKMHEDELVVHSQFLQPADRHYQMWDADGRVLDLHVLDPETGLTSVLESAWTNLRLRGVSRVLNPNVKVAAERGMLTALGVAGAGVRTPRPVGLADAGSSIAVFWEATPPVVPLLKLRDEGEPISDFTLDEAWRELNEAHRKDISHQNLDENAVALDQWDKLWLLNWNQGTVGASDLSHRVDCAQMLVLLSLATTPERAVASGRREIGDAELLAIGLVLQKAVLPVRLRERLKDTDVLDQLRDQLSKIAPSVKAPEPIKLERFSPRTVVMFVVALAAVVAVFGSMNFAALEAAIRQANAWWMVAAFLVGTLNWFGGAIPLVAFAPKRISLWNATITQMAASVIQLVAPAGIGPAALNLRFLNREKISTPVAVATVTLVQLSQFLTTVLLLLLLVVASGSTLDFDLPTTAIIYVSAAIATVAVTIFSIPKLRTWVWGKVQPFWDQAYPQLLWILGHPKQLGLAFFGNVLMNVGFIGAFGLSLYAFGYSMSPLTLAITYFASTTVGSVIPTPGGIGPVEAALTAGLQVAGIPAAVALSTTVVFRLVTFYGRIPIGWLALRAMEKKGLV